MITGAVKNKVDQIWINIAAGGITNPLTVIEQLTYLMFIRSLDVKEIRNEKMGVLTGMKVPHIFPSSPVGQAMRWSHFKNKDADEIFHIVSTFVFPAIKSMKYGQLPDFDSSGKMIPIADRKGDEDSPDTAFSKFMADAAFLIPTAQMLEQIITGMEDLYTNDLENKDMQGDLYEYMLGKLQTSGRNGQFRTPKHIRDMMVALIQPAPEDTICESMSCNIIQLNEQFIHNELKTIVKNSVEETLNALLGAEADKLVQAERYAREQTRKGYRAGHYERSFSTQAGDVTLKVPKLKGLTFESAIIQRYQRRECSVEEALVEMYLAGIYIQGCRQTRKWFRGNL